MLACIRLYICMYISMYVCASVDEEHQWYFRMDLFCLLIMFVFVYIYVCMFICILFPAIHVYKYYSYESILFPVPIGI